MIEAKSYSNSALVEFAQGATSVSAPKLGACSSISTPGSATVDVTAKPNNPGLKTVTCKLAEGATCSLS